LRGAAVQPENENQRYSRIDRQAFADIVLGSIANLIVIEQASAFGIKLTFKKHAAVGIPVTVVSLVLMILWIGIQ
jgi:hypothetical protein